MKNSSPTRIAAGGLIIFVGVLALLGSLELINFGEIWRGWWPLIAIAAGVLLYLNDRRNYVWPIILVLLGVLWQLEILDIVEFNPWQLFWPLVIIAIGWSVAVNRTDANNRNIKAGDHLTAILGSVETKSEDKNYTGSQLTAILGGTVLDLRHAEIKKHATVEVFALMGGIELRVPEGWSVTSSVLPVLGGVENKTVRAQSDNAPTLHIVGNAILGGVEVKH
ncbi:hypothetical protein FJZ39_03110 [Candidatus Saccharibacteria bacterium]|nr:hypothetical protein [Candidatus Saccharibacteria bacterium]